MRIVMFEGLGNLGAASGSDPRVEEVIRQNVAIMRQVQASIYRALQSWRLQRAISGAALPAITIAKMLTFNVSDAVAAWQSSLDTWWSPRLTDAVRENPDRLADWIKMGARIARDAKDLGQEMADDSFTAEIQGFIEDLAFVTGWAAKQGLKGLDAVIPTSWKWIAGGALVLYALSWLPRRR